jgi:hypothetical protein
VGIQIGRIREQPLGLMTTAISFLFPVVWAVFVWPQVSVANAHKKIKSSGVRDKSYTPILWARQR